MKYRQVLLWFSAIFGIFIVLEFLSFLVNFSQNGPRNVINSFRHPTNVNSLFTKIEFIWDPSIGYRYPANSMAHQIMPDENIQPKLVKGFYVDQYGMISIKNNFKSEYNLKEIVNDKTVLRILVSGGSSAFWGASSNEKSFPSVLQKLLEERIKFLNTYKKVVVINSSIANTLVSQQFRRYVDETVYLKPQFIVHFMGLRRLVDNAPLDPVNFSLSGIQKRIAKRSSEIRLKDQFIFFPNLFSLIDQSILKSSRKVKKGYLHPNAIYIEKNLLFLDKVKQFHAIAKFNKSEYLWYLPPVLAYCKSRMGEREERLKRYFGETYYKTPWEEYKRMIVDRYDRISEQILNDPTGGHLKWMSNLSCIFKDEKKEIFRDHKHLNDLGHEIIAHKIFQDVMARL